MKKILILFASLLFASTAMAENEALYDKETGSIEIPVLAVKGQSDKSTATLLQQDSERLIFTMTEMIPDASIESSTNEATYDPESGVIVLPMVMVLTEGKSSVETYSMELQQTEESIFEVTQKEKITALPLNVTNGIAGEGAGLRMLTARSGGSSRWCSGNPDQNLDAAKENFKAKCGEAWDDQKGHVCDYKSDGYHCNGNRSAAASPATSDPSSSTAADTGWCTGTPDRNIDIAKEHFKTACGQAWNDQIGHVCERKTDGWHCRGITSPSGTHIPTKPGGVTVRRWHPNVVFIEWDTEGYNYQYRVRRFEIYRNGEKIGSVNRPRRNKAYFYDRNARGNNRYQIVAINQSNMRSPSSDAVAPTTNSGTHSSSLRSGQRETSRVNDVTVTSPSTGRTVELTNGTVTQTNSAQTVTYDVTSTDGEPLGTMEITHTGGDELDLSLSPNYGGSESVTATIPDEDYRTNGPETNAAMGAVPDLFPDKPRPSNPGGGDKPGGGDDGTGCKGPACGSCSGGPGCRAGD